MKNIAYYNGRISSLEEMMIPMNDRACWFADGVYDVIFTMNRVPLSMKDHLDRLYRSALKAEMPVPMERPELEKLIMNLLSRVDGSVLMIYIQVSRGVAPRAHAFGNTKPSLWIWIKPDVFDPVSRDYRCITQEDTRYYHCDIKTICLLPNVIYAERAEKAGCDESILHRGDRVTECAHSNVHILKGGHLITAPCDKLILPGITRAHRIADCRRLGIPVEERPFTVEELFAADEVFFTSCSALCNRIAEIDGKSVGGHDPETFERILSAAKQEVLEESGGILP